MDFIEKVFHIAPDGGNGMTELAFLLVIFAVIGCVAWRRHTKHRAVRRRY
jgi:hypothetical protein